MVIALLSGLLMLYFSMRVLSAELDVNYLYLTKRLRRFEIDLNDFVEVRTLPLSIYLFFGFAYLISLCYNEPDKRKVAFVVSRGISGWTLSNNSLSEVNKLREHMRDKKNGWWRGRLCSSVFACKTLTCFCAGAALNWHRIKVNRLTVSGAPYETGANKVVHFIYKPLFSNYEVLYFFNFPLYKRNCSRSEG